MRDEENPAIGFHRVQCESLEGPQAVRPVVIEEAVRTILTCNKSPDIPFAWSVNPYRGCTHGCAYCYARRTHEYLDWGAGTDFECKLVVKVNAAERLREAFNRRGWRREQVAFSGVTDCYQPLEAKYRLTRRCLEVCLEYANPVGVVTKSTLVTRDVDLLVELQRRRSASVLFSIALADAGRARVLEPGAPSPEQRFRAMRYLRDAGVEVGLMVAPVIPGLNDRDIPALLARGAEAGASHACCSPVRLPGTVADVFLGRLRRDFPDAAERVEARVRELRGGRLNNPEIGRRMEVGGAYWESVQRLFETTATRLGLSGGQRWREASPVLDRPGPKQLALFETG